MPENSGARLDERASARLGETASGRARPNRRVRTGANEWARTNGGSRTIAGIATRSIHIAAPAALLSACNRHQSALSPFGLEAESTRTLTIVLLVGAVIVAVAMSLLMRHAIRTPGGRLTHKGGMKLVLWFGGVLPVVLLFALLVASLPAMRPIPTAPADLRVRVEGEQFWWRVAYRPAGRPAVTTANEVRLPVGRTVALELAGGDVIHSFWIPGLAGKMDMIPGRTNRLIVRATRPGRFRGVCTEFCGLSHALMAFDVVAMEPAAFDRWLAAEARPAAAVQADAGGRLFAGYGCGGCHAIRGTDQAGVIGPELTHLGARASMAAGIMPTTTANLASFIRHPEGTKPGVRMPAFPHMPQRDAVAIARYLQGLK